MEAAQSDNNTGSSPIPTKILPSAVTVQGLASWIVKPLNAVGNLNGDLLSTPSGQDHVTRVGCGSQSYTSWESYSRSYVCSIEVQAGEAPRARVRRAPQLEALGGDDPTQSELDGLDRLQRAILKAGGAYIRALNEVFSPTQMSTTKVRRKIFTARNPTANEAEVSAALGEGRERRSVASEAESVATGSGVSTAPSESSTGVSAPVSGEVGSAASQPSVPKSGCSDLSGSSDSGAGGEARDDLRQGAEFGVTLLPVRHVDVSSWRPAFEAGGNVPYTPLYTAYVNRLSDPSATGPMSSMARGVSIRDGASIMSLCRHLQGGTGSVLDIAPVVRMACMGLSVMNDNYASDPIFYRVVRQFKPDVERPATYISPDTPAQCDGQILAVGLDTFISLMMNKTPLQVQNGSFRYTEVDVTWTAVPVRSSFLIGRHVVPFIAGFLSSAYWAGRVNVTRYGDYVSNAGDRLRGSISVMPSCNSVDIPGPKDILLVLMDATVFNPQSVVFINGHRIPVYAGGAIAPAHFGPIFYDWYNNANMAHIGADCAMAINEMSSLLGVENAVDLGLSLSAELYAAQYQGLSLNTYNGNPARVDYASPCFGGWSFFDGQEIPDTGVKLKYLGEDHSKTVRRLVGYNFTSISSWSLPPSGIVPAAKKTTPAGKKCVFWASTDFRCQGSPGQLYTATQVDSITRVSIGVGLISVQERATRFPYGPGMGSWLHMLSGAFCAQTASIFACTNVDLGIWTGYNMAEDTVFGTEYMTRLIETATHGLATYNPYDETVKRWEALRFDPYILSEYWSLDVFFDLDWMTHHPLPYYFISQWIRKQKSFEGVAPSDSASWWFGGSMRLGLRITPDTRAARLDMVGSPSLAAYCPLVFGERVRFRGLEVFNVWFDQFSMITNYSAYNFNVAKPKILTTQGFVVPPVDGGLPGNNDFNIYVVGSGFENMDDERREARFSALQYPDPPTLSDVITAAKHWLVYPGLSALGGYMSGGPVGAAVAGGTHLVKNVVEKLTTPGPSAPAPVLPPSGTGPAPLTESVAPQTPVTLTPSTPPPVQVTDSTAQTATDGHVLDQAAQVMTPSN